MTTISISASPEKRKPIVVDLVGHEYTITPLKGMAAVKIAKIAEDDNAPLGKKIDALLEWVKAAAGTEQAKKISKRLNDPKDDLDIEHLIELIQKVTEAYSGIPTT